MNILALTFCGGKCGSTVNLGFIVSCLTKRGHSVFVPYSKKDEGSRYLENCGAKIIHCPVPLAMNTATVLESSKLSMAYIFRQNLKDIIRFPIGYFLVAFFILKTKSDIVFSSDLVFPQAILAGKLLKRINICGIQSEVIKGKNGIRRKIIIRIVNNCQKIFAITEYHLRPFVKGHIDKSKYSVVPNTIFNESFQEAVNANKQTSVASKYSKQIFFMGGDIPCKGVNIIRKIASISKERNLSFIFILAGPFKNEFDGDNIKIIGEIPDIVDVLKKSDLLLVANSFPHFSRPMIEAFSTKTPVLAISDRFTRNISENGKNAFLIDSIDPNMWLNKICNIFKNESVLRTKTDEAYKKYLSSYNPEIVKNKIVEIFESNSL